MSVFPCQTISADLCVVGGGMAGVCAAVAAARHGLRVVLMHDRPVLGGNSSSECRVHICGADRHDAIPNMRETGILEELRLENLYRNPQRSFSMWDTVLYDAIRRECNITLLLNCSCTDAEMDAKRIRHVTGWQLTTQKRIRVEASIFADTSGDAILAPLTGAAARMGREAREEFGESIAPEIADDRTMGMTCLFQLRKHDEEHPFIPPDWAYRYDTCEELPYGEHGHRWFEMGYWWVELGGEAHSIHDTEELRDELLRIAFGVWDHVKNRCPNKADASQWALDWVQFLPGKRESRRYLGDHVLSQQDIETGGEFDDVVAYGGWTMDDHHPAGFNAVTLGVPATIFHEAPSPYGIPYRCLYSRDIPNLMFAGRDASCTHAAMSSTRVMGTGCSMGQAVGTAAAFAVHRDLTPRDVGENVAKVQQTLLDDDAYLPGLALSMPGLTRSAVLSASTGDPEPVRDGVGRPVRVDRHCWIHGSGDFVEYQLGKHREVGRAHLILDSALDRIVALSYHQKDDQLTRLPDELPRDFRVDLAGPGGWETVAQVTDNRRRRVRINVGRAASRVRYVLERTWGPARSKLFGFWIE